MTILLLIISLIAFAEGVVISNLLGKINTLNYQIRTKDRQLNYHRAMNKGRW